MQTNYSLSIAIMKSEVLAQKRKDPGYYNDIDHILEEISQCDSKKEFREEHNGAYYACRKLGKYDELCIHLSDKQDVLIWNDKGRIHQEALRYQSKTEFAKHNGSAFAAAHRLAILDIVCSHMQSGTIDDMSNKDNEFSKIIEVASTCDDFDEFRKDHGEEYISALRLNAIDTVANCIPQQAYSITENELFKLAEQYNTFAEFELKHRKQCRAARQTKVINDLKYIFQDKQRNHLRTKEQVLEIAQKCSSYKEFHDNYSLIYAEARKNGWLPEIFKVLPKVKITKYTKRKCISLAKKYKTRRDFATNEPSAYNAALENDWLNEIDAILPRKVSRPYDEQRILELADECVSYTQFIKDYRYAYNAAIRLGILEKVKNKYHNLK